MKFTSKTLLEKVFDIINKESIFETNEIFNNFTGLIEYMLDLNENFDNCEEDLSNYIDDINIETKNKFTINDIDKIKQFMLSYILNPKNWKRVSKQKLNTHYNGKLDEYSMYNGADYNWINKNIDMNSFKPGDKVIRRVFLLRGDFMHRDMEFGIITNESDTEIISFGTAEED